jgi:DNA-binding FadR family transcriptional regulator
MGYALRASGPTAPRKFMTSSDNSLRLTVSPQMQAPSLAPGELAGGAPEPLRVEKLGSVVARRIEAEVTQSGWQVGQSLGSEPELILRYGVSRSTLREAIRQLEAHGAVRTRRGVGGGLIVAEAPHRAAARTLAVFLELINASVDELFEARKILEPLGARLAAERALAPDVDRLGALMAELEAAPTNFEVTVPLHIAIRDLIGEMAKNPALTIFVSALPRSTVESFATEIAANYPTSGVPRGTDFKRRTVDAVVGGRGAEAEAVLRDDLDNQHAGIKRNFEARAEREKVSGPPTARPTGLHPKLGQMVAVRIAHEISRGELAPGQKLGAEADLLRKYGVSRAVFREAIRILEAHGFVRTRRGHAGGLLVAEPDSAYATTQSVEYLRASGMSLEHFTEIRAALAMNAAQLAAERITPEGRAKLEQALAANLAAPECAVLESSRCFHVLIGDLTQNRALAIINRVTVQLSAGPGEDQSAAAMSTTLKRNNVRICDAIIAGDGLLARRRVIEHMDDIARWTAGEPPALGRAAAAPAGA